MLCTCPRKEGAARRNDCRAFYLMHTTAPECNPRFLRYSRPKTVRLVSGVGSEEVDFEPAVPLEGKVEIYMQVLVTIHWSLVLVLARLLVMQPLRHQLWPFLKPTQPLISRNLIYLPSQDVLDVTKVSLFNNLKRSLGRYMEMSRPKWLMHKNPTSGEKNCASSSSFCCINSLDLLSFKVSRASHEHAMNGRRTTDVS